MSNRIGCLMIVLPCLALAGFLLHQIVTEAGWTTVLLIAGGVIGTTVYFWIATSLMLRRRKK